MSLEYGIADPDARRSLENITRSALGAATGANMLTIRACAGARQLAEEEDRLYKDSCDEERTHWHDDRKSKDIRLQLTHAIRAAERAIGAAEAAHKATHLAVVMIEQADDAWRHVDRLLAERYEQLHKAQCDAAPDAIRMDEDDPDNDDDPDEA